MPPEVEEGASESSSVRDDLLAAIKEHSTEQSEPAQNAGHEEAPTQAESRARDEGGRFVAKEATDPAASPGSVKTADARGTVSTVEPANSVPRASPENNQNATELAAAPPAWSNAVKAKWPTLDPEVRSEILKREADVHRGMTKQDDERAFAREMQKVTAPYEAMIRAAGGTIPGAVSDVLNTAYILRTADPNTKARTIAQVCQLYGVDLRLLAQPQGEVNPQVAALQQRLQQLEGQLTQRQQQEQQQAEQQVLTQIEAFGQDPKHPHFRAVSTHMGALMQAGEAKDMEQAYEMAVWARPDLRAQLLAAQTAQQTQAQQTRQRTEKARAKAVSVRGGPGGYTAPAPNPNASVRESLMAALEEVNSRI